MFDLEAIKARCEAATPGPWSLRTRNAEPAIVSDSTGLEVARQPRGNAPLLDDAAFISAARADVPALVAEVERLRDEALAALRDVVDVLEEFAPDDTKLAKALGHLRERHQAAWPADSEEHVHGD